MPALAELAADGLIIRPVWRPFLLYPATPQEGFPQQAHLRQRFGSLETAARYHEGVTEAGTRVGLAIRYDRITATPSSVDAHRLLLLAAPDDPMALADTIGRAFLEEGRDIADRSLLCRLAVAAGLEANAVDRMFATDRLLAETRAANAAARRGGILQVPAFCLHGRILSVPDIEDLAGTLRTAHRALAPAPASHRT